MTSATRTHHDRTLPTGFALVAAGRFVSNVGVRSVYPFLPTIADGLGVSLTALGAALALRELVGITTPLYGGLIDRSHLGTTMAFGLALVAIAATGAAASSGVVQFTIALGVMSVGKNVFDVAATAWIARGVPFVVRGRAIGIIELTWAGSFLIAMPILALVIRAGTWRSAMLLIALAVLPIAAATRRVIVDVAADVPMTTPGAAARFALLAAPVGAMAAIGIGHQAVLVSFASWLEDTHGFTVASLGLTAFLLGTAELGGTLGSIRFSDRLGKRTCVLIGGVAMLPALAILPAGGSSAVLAMALLCIVFALFEFTFVSFLPLFSELDPGARATVMAWAFGAFGAGHAIGATIGAGLYEQAGIVGTVSLAGAAFAVAMAIVFTRLAEPT
ncbi:MAG: MFS transporter [Acidimicrobiales bacterium]